MTLTERQEEIVRHYAQGVPTKKIASILNISQKTVEYHLAFVKRKAKIRDNIELVHWAIFYRICGNIFSKTSLDNVVIADEIKTLSEVEKTYCLKVLEMCGFNRRLAAKKLGISIRGFRYKLNSWGFLTLTKSVCQKV